MNRYLERYAEREAAGLAATLPDSRWESAVVVPSYGEDDIVDGLLASLEAAAPSRTLGILVVNAPEGASEEKLAANHRLLARLGGEGVRRTGTMDWLVVHRTFGARDGVGRARKLGADIATVLASQNRLASNYFHTTDADALVDSEYFAEPDGDEAARWHRYLHELEGPLAVPLALYEIHLRYYVQGLERARSPYAFPTIGSTMSVRYDAYAAVRGFPRRDAGEDFHLFDKLAKVGRIGVAKGTVTLRARASDRVPFGTGAGIAKIAEQITKRDVYRLFDPRAFDVLGDWLRSLDAFAEHRDVTKLPAVSERLGAKRAIEAGLATRRDSASLRRHLHTWFDGLRTLQFLNDLAKSEFPKVPWDVAVGAVGEDPRAVVARLRECPI